ncbi:DUF1194 domain-containing protein [Nisaea nitritireducens]|uniref:DUF1194 domain-containing protein n=1 Tax=Nisaea nitritireducens TaxID=568392 RepID=UPI001D0279F8|nr:DUF1194 domain-containing protein [Nisaea nitritireducens]
MGRAGSLIYKASIAPERPKKLSTGKFRFFSNKLSLHVRFMRGCLPIALGLLWVVSYVPYGIAQPVDLELVFAADGSGSIDDDELLLQRQGYADALLDSRVLEAVTSGRWGKIVVSYIEWGDEASQHTIVDWREIAGPKDARAFGEALLSAPRAAWGYNSISEAIAYSTDKILTNTYEGVRMVIDVSGDGPQIGGRPIDWARDRAVDAGITINALVVKSRGGGHRGPGNIPLEMHYRLDVIGGLGAFAMVADEETPFADVLLAKIIREIADARPTGHGRDVTGIGITDPAIQYAENAITCGTETYERTGTYPGCKRP